MAHLALGMGDAKRHRPPFAVRLIEAKDTESGTIDIWGNGEQTRSFMYIDDCTVSVDKIMHCDELIAKPINLGSSELLAINKVADLAEEIGGVKHKREHDLDAPQGVAGRNSDNTMIKAILGWEPDTPFRVGWRRPTPGSSSNISIEKQGNTPLANL